MSAKAFAVKGFKTKYITKPDGTLVAEDWVEYGPLGAVDKTCNEAPVAALAKIDTNADPANPAYQMALGRWLTIKPLYEAWKTGQEAPVDGVPLAAWPGVSSEQVELLRGMGFRTVEEIAEASDGLTARIPLPNAREIQANARRFLAARDQAKVAAKLGEKDREIAELKDQLDEMRAMMVAMQEEATEQRQKRGKGKRDDAKQEANV
ncbi:MAG TPA: hypothetical protein VNK48_14650 [Xanthobacteraceae bacterium]|nr:hypothetical protein [Xanthobacteraceae bacterium]